MKVGILALHGDVEEHRKATLAAAKNLGLKVEVCEVRTARDLEGVTHLILPGGESSSFSLLMRESELLDAIKKRARTLKFFGTCAGLILLAKKFNKGTVDQVSLELLDVEVDRNAYGRQRESFEAEIDTKLGKINGVFIRAPRILKLNNGVEVLAEYKGEPVAVKEGNILACSFHPELTTTKFHELFLKGN
ncbi:Pyridoxal 5'-phosphate synthase subunit PdxT [Candidatus Gugararchaeum adminiculabundum]|nr:Pyridoxal 5'-phosphate synthase subunit PdxT [Candidatus Gugararchaeum adminiculabundum]